MGARPNRIAPPRTREGDLYFSRLPARPSVDYVQAVTAFMAAGVANGWWPRVSCISLLHERSSTGWLLNLKGPLYGWIINGDMQHTADVGARRGPANTGYLGQGKTAIALATEGALDLNDVSLFCFTLDDAGGATDEIGSAGGGATLAIRANNLSQMSAWSNAVAYTSIRAPEAGGFAMVSRDTASGGLMFKNDASAAFSLASVVLPGSELTAFKVSGTTSPHTMSIIGFGRSMTQAQGQAMNADCEALMGALSIDKVYTPIVSTSGPNAFGRTGPYSYDAVSSIGLPIMMQGTPPASNTIDYTTYPYFPMSDCAAQAKGHSTSSQTYLRAWEFVASDRALGPAVGTVARLSQPNGIGGTVVRASDNRRCRLEYPTYDMAQAATEARMLWSAGGLPVNEPKYRVKVGSDGIPRPDPAGTPTGWLDVARLGGFDVSGWASYVQALTGAQASGNQAAIAAALVPFTQDNATLATGQVLHKANLLTRLDELFTANASYGDFVVCPTPLMYLPEVRLCDATSMAYGFFDDIETADLRGTTRFFWHVKRKAAIAAAFGYKYGIVNDRVSDETGLRTGWDPGINYQILADPNVTFACIVVARDDPGQTLFDVQINAFKGPIPLKNSALK